MSGLRVGLLLDSSVQPAWVRRILERIGEGDSAEVVVVVRNTTPPPTPASLTARLAMHRDRLAYLAYSKLDRQLFGRPGSPLERASVEDLLADVPVLDVCPEQSQ